jgi:glycosyltransferase involved in cell wall biosynthesis
LITSQSADTLRQLNINLFLLIDYRNAYHQVLESIKAPIILWARDPRTQQQISKISHIRIPGGPDDVPKGCEEVSATGASTLFKEKGSRQMAIGTVWLPALRDRLWEAYLIPPAGNWFELPNILDDLQPVGKKASTPKVLFLARLDPYKRPWLMVELAKAFRHVEFWVAGHSHFEGPGSYTVNLDEHPNIHVLDYVDGIQKERMLTEAWFLVSTSAHEGVAISFLEALKCETPILGMVDPGGLVSSYGVYAGDFEGTGMTGMDALKNGFQQLLSNPDLRTSLGKAGREHVLATYTGKRFFEGFVALAKRVGIPTSATELNQADQESLPVTVVIPSCERASDIHMVLSNLLNMQSMTHPDTEILLVHVCPDSFRQRASIHTQTQLQCRNAFSTSKIIHLDYVALNAEIGCNSRHFAALEAKNRILVHLDDDLMPTDDMVNAMVQEVQNERPFPNCGFYGYSHRNCGTDGYCIKDCQDSTDPSFVLINIASMSAELNKRFVASFNSSHTYRELGGINRGNGCDLLFNHVAMQLGIKPQLIKQGSGSDDLQYVSNQSQLVGYSTEHDHYIYRDQICRCMGRKSLTAQCAQEYQSKHAARSESDPS